MLHSAKLVDLCLTNWQKIPRTGRSRRLEWRVYVEFVDVVQIPCLGGQSIRVGDFESW